MTQIEYHLFTINIPTENVFFVVCPFVSGFTKYQIEYADCMKGFERKLKSKFWNMFFNLAGLFTNQETGKVKWSVCFPKPLLHLQ